MMSELFLSVQNQFLLLKGSKTCFTSKEIKVLNQESGFLQAFFLWKGFSGMLAKRFAIFGYLLYSYFNDLRCPIKASSLQDKTEGEYGILMNNYQQN